MQYFVFNFSDGDREQVAALLHAKMWGVGSDERHRDVLAPGDIALIFVAKPRGEFIGRAELATAVHEWAPSEADAYPGDLPSGVLFASVEEWPQALSMDVVVARIDPTGSNPLVQANATGFPRGVVQITADEYDATVALSREAQET
jgi:hypothetical protein